MTSKQTMPEAPGSFSLRVIPIFEHTSCEAQANLVNPKAGVLAGDYITLSFPNLNLSFSIPAFEDTSVEMLVASGLAQFREHQSRSTNEPGRSILSILASHYLDRKGYTEIPTEILVRKIMDSVSEREAIINYVHKPDLEA